MLPTDIRAVSFAVFARKGTFEKEETYRSLDALISRTGCNAVTLVPFGLQDTPQSEDITWERTVSDAELVRCISYIHEKGCAVFLKPTVNCANGSWRAFISFFEEDVICEPKWGNWFRSYSAFQCHYAEIAGRTGCELFIAGCEMVMSEHREEEWRGVIRDIRKVYHGPVSYNTDKYQEHNVKWWDAVDIISSSGYYPSGSWDRELMRIEQTVKTFGKPFFFAETGCMSVSGSAGCPNLWSLKGSADCKEQEEWYREMTEAVKRHPFVRGICLWDWPAMLYPEAEARLRKDYSIYAKPAENVIREYFLGR